MLTIDNTDNLSIENTVGIPVILVYYNYTYIVYKLRSRGGHHLVAQLQRIGLPRRTKASIHPIRKDIPTSYIDSDNLIIQNEFTGPSIARTNHQPGGSNKN